MMSGHLSDEAVAAFADGVLTGHARGRATRHTAECAECAAAVREQREAVFALRAAPAPALPTDLLDRLRGLPQVTPVRTPPTVVLPDGSRMLSTLAPAAALVAPTPRSAPAPQQHRPNPFATTAAAVVLAGALATGGLVAGAAGGDGAPQQGTAGTNDTVRTVVHRSEPGGAAEPAATWLDTGAFHRDAP